MNNNDFSSNQVGNDTYHATSNLNTAIENPEFNVNNAVDVNVQGASYNDPSTYQAGVGDFSNTGVGDISSFENGSGGYGTSEPGQFIPNSSSEVSQSNQVNDGSTYQAADSNASYAPVMESHKKKTVEKPEVSSELKVTIMIGLVLVLFLMAMPYVYDFFKGFGLVFTR